MANIEQTAQLNKLLEQQSKLYTAQEESLKNQLTFTRQLVAALRDLNIADTAESANNLNKAVHDAANSLENFKSGQQTMHSVRDAVRGAVEETDELDNSLVALGKSFLKLAPVAGTLEGIVGGFNVMKGAMTSVLSVGSSVFSTLLNIGASIVMAPIKMLGSLMGAAASGGGGELRQAMEDLRKEFGDLAHNESQSVLKAWRSVDHFGGQLAETGLSIFRTMGNMAESMRALTEIAKNMGVNFSNLHQQLAGGAERLFAYVKGLHLSEDGVRALAETAHRTGTSVQELGRQFTQMAFGMGEDFGINGALISHDMGEMLADFGNFGNLATRELAEISVFARKLGVEVKALLGVVDTFDNFEDAATSVAQLSQAFGTQLDTMDLMNAQNPAERVDMLRKAFAATGRSVENMTRQERALLASHSGIAAEDVKMVFAKKNLGMSYADIQKKGKANEKSQISQTEAMQKLAGSIERLVKSGAAMQGGFFDIFFQGFLRGVKWTKEFHGIMWNLRRAMREVRWAGVRVGRAFVKSFPGVKEFLTGIRDIFNRQKWRRMTRGVVRIFRTFFNAIAGNDPHAVKNFLKNMQENFFNWFSSRSTAGMRVLNGMKKFTKAFIQIAGQLFAEAMKGLGRAFRGIADFIRNPSAFLESAASGGSGFLSFFMEAVGPAFEAIKEAWPELRDGFMDLIETAWEKIKPMLIKFMKKHLVKVLTFAVGPSVIGGAGRGLTAGLGALFTRGILGAFTGSQGRKQTKALTEGISALSSAADRISGAGGEAAKAGKATAGVSASAKQAQVMSASTKGFGIRDAVALGAKLVAIAAALSVGGVMVATAVLAIIGILGGQSITNIATALGVITTAVLEMIPMAYAIKLLPAINGGAVAKAALGIGALGIFVVAVAAAMRASKEILGNFSMEDALRVGMILAIGELLFTGAAGVAYVAASLGGVITGSSGLAGAAILIGLAAIGGILLAIGGVMQSAKFALGNFSIGDAQLVGAVLGTGEILFVGAAAVALASAGTGALIVAAAPLIVLGMVAIGAMLRGIGEGMTTAYNTINGLPEIGDAFNAKLEAFMTITQMIVSFSGALTRMLLASAIATLVTVMAGPLGALQMLITGGPMEQVKEILVEMKGTVVDILHTVGEVAGRIGPNELKGIEAMGPILTSVIGLMEALQPPEGLSGLVNNLFPVATANIVSSYMRDIKEAIVGENGLINTIFAEGSSIMSSIATLSGENISTEGVQAFAAILGAVSGMLKALSTVMSQTTETSIAEDITNLAETYFRYATPVGLALTAAEALGLVEGEESPLQQKITAMTGLMGSLIKTFVTSGILGEIRSIIASVGSALGGLTEGQIKGIGPLTQMMSSVFSFLGIAMENLQIDPAIVATLAEGGSHDHIGTLRGVVQNFAGRSSVAIQQLIATTAEQIGPMLENVIAATSGITTRGMNKAVKGAEAIVGMLSALGGMLTTIRSAGLSKTSFSTGENTAEVAEVFRSGQLDTVISSLDGLINSFFGSESGNKIKQIVDAIVGARMWRIPRNIGTKIEAITSIVDLISTLANSGFQDGISGLSSFRVDLRSTVGGSMIGNISLLIQNLIGSFGGLFEEPGVKAGLNSLTPRRAARLKAVGAAITTTLDAVDRIKTVMDSGIISRLQNGSRNHRGFTGLHTFIQHLLDPTWGGTQHFITTFSKMKAMPRGTQNKLTGYKNTFTKLNEMVEVFESGFGQIEDGFSERIRSGVQALITSIGEAGTSLQQLGQSPIELSAELRRVNNALNLSGAQTLRIKQQAVTLNICLNVKMDSEELARTLVTNESSRVIIDNAVT